MASKYAMNRNTCFGELTSANIDEISRKVKLYYKEHSYEKVADIIFDDAIFMDQLEEYIEENKINIIIDKKAMICALEELHDEEDDYIMYQKHSMLLIKLYINSLIGG